MVESLGIWGLTWQEKIITAMHDIVPKEIKILPRNVDTLHVAYLAAMRSGQVPPLFVNKTIDNNGVQLVAYLKKSVNSDPLISKGFLYGLYTLSKTGKIPFSKYDPSGVEKNTVIAKSYSQDPSWLDKTGNVLKSASTRIMLLGALFLASYIVITKRK